MEFINEIVKQIEAANGNWLILLGLGVFLSVYVLKRTEVFPTKVLAGVSVIIGIVIGAFVTWMTGENVMIGVYDGFLAGLIASGGYDFIRVIMAFATGKVTSIDDVMDVMDDGEINNSNKK